MKKYLEERRVDGENESVLLSVEEEQMGGGKSLSGGRNELWLFKHFVIKLALCCDLFLF